MFTSSQLTNSSVIWDEHEFINIHDDNLINQNFIENGKIKSISILKLDKKLNNYVNYIDIYLAIACFY
jgi:hypothetical protein